MKIIYYAACSLDSFIAGRDGNIDWLFTDDDYGYAAFFSSVDALVIGNTTYKQILDFGAWPYEKKPSFVFTNHGNDSPLEHLHFVSGDVSVVASDLEKKGFHRVWLVGGSDIAAQFVKANLVDDLILSIHPILLGSGIPLLKYSPELQLKIKRKRQFKSGLVQVHYTPVQN